MVVTLIRYIIDPMLVKQKCVWEVADFLKNCKQTAEKCKQIFENWKKLPPLKHILALPTWGQTCTVSELQPFEISIFQTKHPVSWLLVCVKLAHFRNVHLVDSTLLLCDTDMMKLLQFFRKKMCSTRLAVADANKSSFSHATWWD